MELEKYKQVYKTLDNYMVNASFDDIYVEYYAHTNIDEVYGLEGLWGLIDKDNNIIIKPTYVYPFIECGDNYQVMLPHEYKEIDGKKKIILLRHGLIDRKGKIIIPVKYLYMEAMDSSGTYFRVVDSNTYKSGVIDKHNNIIVPLIYDYIPATPDLELMKNNIYPDNIYQVKVCKNDLYGVYDLKLKKEIIKPKYNYLKIIGYNKFLIRKEDNNEEYLYFKNKR